MSDDVITVCPTPLVHRLQMIARQGKFVEYGVFGKETSADWTWISDAKGCNCCKWCVCVAAVTCCLVLLLCLLLLLCCCCCYLLSGVVVVFAIIVVLLLLLLVVWCCCCVCYYCCVVVAVTCCLVLLLFAIIVVVMLFIELTIRGGHCSPYCYPTAISMLEKKQLPVEVRMCTM